MNKHLEYILKKQCEYVGITINDIDITKDGWYNEYEWTEEQENDYKKWLKNELKTNHELRKELTKLPYRAPEVRLDAAVNWILLFCGWTTNYSKEEKD